LVLDAGVSVRPGMGVGARKAIGIEGRGMEYGAAGEAGERHEELAKASHGERLDQVDTTNLAGDNASAAAEPPSKG